MESYYSIGGLNKYNDMAQILVPIAFFTILVFLFSISFWLTGKKRIQGSCGGLGNDCFCDSNKLNCINELKLAKASN